MTNRPVQNSKTACVILICFFNKTVSREHLSHLSHHDGRTYSACQKDDSCQSFNFVISVGMCEFSDRTREAIPEDFIPDPDRYYFRRAMNRGNKAMTVSFCFVLFFFGGGGVPGTGSDGFRSPALTPTILKLLQQNLESEKYVLKCPL